MSKFGFYLVAAVLVIQVPLSYSSFIDNEVLGIPVVQCKKNSIHFAVETRNPFKGKVYVKGEYEHRECIKYFGSLSTANRGNIRLPLNQNELPDSNVGRRFHSYFPGGDGAQAPNVNNHGSWYTVSQQRHQEKTPYRVSGVVPDPEGLSGGFDARSNSVFIARSKECPLQCPPCDSDENRRLRRKTNQAEIELELGTCSLRRDRTLSPPGVQVSVVVVVSFHENFITKVDRAYHIQCAYGEANKTVTTEFDVNQQEPQNIDQIIEAPKCHYEIMDSNGRLSKNVRIGDTIEHRWVCDSATPEPIELYIFMECLCMTASLRMDREDENWSSTALDAQKMGLLSPRQLTSTTV
ncbi:hypothetical protein L596_002937 [Steinernema carpocapsae]|uniref:ZP domain-containing protein n=1 Tax=Steinernema carpocapsae TaxID=34508 RepID=A0A4U8USK9_STECR|nr:hypothetical protein L596_002937 [Steinernema carpocapsae]